MMSKTNQQWNKLFVESKARFPFGPVNNLEAVFQDPQVEHNKTVVTMNHKNCGEIKLVSIFHWSFQILFLKLKVLFQWLGLIL